MFEEQFDKVYEEDSIQYKISQIKDEFYSKWSDLNITGVDRIKDKWQSKEAIEFVEQITKLNDTVNRIMNNFDDLSDCWKIYMKKKEEAEEEKRKNGNSTKLY